MNMNLYERPTFKPSNANLDPLIRFSQTGHSVQFYDDDEEFLFKMAANFLSPNLNNNTAIVVISTQACRDYLTKALKSRGATYDKALAENRVQMLDIDSVLHEITGESGIFDIEKFNTFFRPQIEQLAQSCSKIFAYGNIANMLIESGQIEAAFHEEELWTDLTKIYNLTILCSYNIKNINSLDDYQRICALHTETHGF